MVIRGRSRVRCGRRRTLAASALARRARLLTPVPNPRHRSYVIIGRYAVGGLVLDNYATTLPAQKGLSSSAALCVLLTRAFSRVYDLKLSVADEMELAYLGETATPSLCGRMDQCCAFGVKPVRAQTPPRRRRVVAGTGGERTWLRRGEGTPERPPARPAFCSALAQVLMEFDGDKVSSRPLLPGGPLHLVIVDLGAAKDTVRILAGLNACYPVADTPEKAQVRARTGGLRRRPRLARRLPRGCARRTGRVRPPAADACRRALPPRRPTDSQPASPTLKPTAAQVHWLLGEYNRATVGMAAALLEAGDCASLGALMTEAQAHFDRCAAPLCPAELGAPVLHRVLAHPPLQPRVFGGKGVGSQVAARARARARVGALGMGRAARVVETGWRFCR